MLPNLGSMRISHPEGTKSNRPAATGVSDVELLNAVALPGNTLPGDTDAAEDEAIKAQAIKEFAA